MKKNAKAAPEKATTAKKPKEAPQFIAPANVNKMSVAELQARYLEVVGRPTKSDNKAYLIWKIREAQKGRVPVGPRKHAPRSDATFKTLPLRMEANTVEALDAARQRMGLPSRMALIRLALHAYLLDAGEVKAAALFAPDHLPEADA